MFMIFSFFVFKLVKFWLRFKRHMAFMFYVSRLLISKSKSLGVIFEVLFDGLSMFDVFSSGLFVLCLGSSRL